jgi:gluconokinase
LVIVVAGVSGSGKTTIGLRLARYLRADFLDADSLHDERNIEKMRAGIALTDVDRQPWLDQIAERVAEALDHQEPLVVACSALKQSYRRRVDPHGDGRILWIILHGDRELLASRLAARIGHFMSASLLDDQLETFEPPRADENAMVFRIEGTPAEIVARIASSLEHQGPGSVPPGKT